MGTPPGLGFGAFGLSPLVIVCDQGTKHVADLDLPPAPAPTRQCDRKKPGVRPCELACAAPARTLHRVYPAPLPGLPGTGQPCEATPGRFPVRSQAEFRRRWLRSHIRPTIPVRHPTASVPGSGRSGVGYPGLFCPAKGRAASRAAAAPADTSDAG